MNSFFNRLHYSGQKTILCIDFPEEFQTQLQQMRNECEIHTTPFEDMIYEYIIVFATNQDELKQKAALILPQTNLSTVLWFCIPKYNAKEIETDFPKNYTFDFMEEMDFKRMQKSLLSSNWLAYKFKKVIPKEKRKRKK